MDSKIAVKQLKALRKIVSALDLRLAAEGWRNDFEILISTILSAQTRDEVTIEVCENLLFPKYPDAKSLGRARLATVEKIIRPINYHRTKAKNIIATAKILEKNFGGKVPHEMEELLKFPGVGRKVANVFLVEAINAPAIGVDTHVGRISRKIGWSKNENPHKVEKDLEKLFPKKYWNSINYILVKFGRTIGRSRKREDEVLGKLIN